MIGMSRTPSIRKIQDANVRHRRVLLRVDINVETNGRQVRDDSRLIAIAPTIKWLVKNQAKIIIVAHLGRPTKRDPRFSLRPLAAELSRIIRRKIQFVDQPVDDPKLDKIVAKLENQQIIMLENIRFEPGETKNDPRLAKRLASLAEIGVNDAFPDSHRAHASIAGVAKYIPMYAGFELQQEIKMLSRLLHHPPRPFIALIGGAKISTKLGLVKNLLKVSDSVLLGGALANTVLQAQGLAVGASLTEPKMIKAARGLKTTTEKLRIPIDVIVGRNKRRSACRAVGRIKKTEKILDIGPDTIDLYSAVINKAKTIVWNGPLGLYELPPYNRGTVAIARAISRNRGLTVAGGGETLDAIGRQKLGRHYTFLSTGGGAMLEWLEGKTLPGIKAVMKGKRS
jgi:phosphoglycerate kinase